MTKPLGVVFSSRQSVKRLRPGRAYRKFVERISPVGLTEKPLQESWNHDTGADRVEHIAAYNANLGDRMGRIALRFISEKGLSEEFADVLGEIEQIIWGIAGTFHQVVPDG